jgi:hypothetical protein
MPHERFSLRSRGRLRSTLHFLFAAWRAVPHGLFCSIKHFAKNHARNGMCFWAFDCQILRLRSGFRLQARPFGKLRVMPAERLKMYCFALLPWPKILLTAVFFSPIIRTERPRAASAGKPLKRPERPAPLQSAGHRWVHSNRSLMV